MIEFQKKDATKEKRKDKRSFQSKAGVDKGKSYPKFGNASKSTHNTEAIKGDKPKRKFEGCFLCGGTHLARDWPSRTKLAAIAQSLEQENEKKVTCMKRLDAKQAKINPTRKGRMYVEATLGQRTLWALIDTGADANYINEGTTKSLGLTWTSLKGHFKGVNGEWKEVTGEAKGVPIQIRSWIGNASFSIVPLDDYEMVLGMEFIDHIQPVIVPSNYTLVIMQGGDPCVVKVCRETRLGPNQLSKGLHRGERTIAAILVEKEPPTEDPIPDKHIHQKLIDILKDFKDVMPEDLPKELPPRREIDHKIELVDRVKPIAAAPYRMSSKQARWLDYLAEFKYELEYTSGKTNYVAGGLSRKSMLAPIINTPTGHLLDRIKEG